MKHLCRCGQLLPGGQTGPGGPSGALGDGPFGVRAGDNPHAEGGSYGVVVHFGGPLAAHLLVQGGQDGLDGPVRVRENRDQEGGTRWERNDSFREASGGLPNGGAISSSLSGESNFFFAHAGMTCRRLQPFFGYINYISANRSRVPSGHVGYLRPISSSFEENLLKCSSVIDRTQPARPDGTKSR